MGNNDIDLRSYFPKFERTLTWIDGTKYQIREVEDLSEAEFHAMVDDEQKFADMSATVRADTNKRHLQSMLVFEVAASASATKGQHELSVQDGADLLAGDVVYLCNGLNVERNVVESVAGRSIRMQSPWKFDASSSASRLYRAIRIDALNNENLTQQQFMIAVATVKSPPRDEKAAEQPTQ